MANKDANRENGTVGAWAKRCFFAGRALMEEVLRPHGLGSTQWYILHLLAQVGPTMQRDLVSLLQIERATVSIIVSALVRKGLIEQVPSDLDQRQKLLRLTPAGMRLWDELPDLAFIHDEAFSGFSAADIETTARVLRAATERLNHRLKGKKA
ncbi:MarR family winged helix-turn-helix transcriptional regulator [Flavisphingomonas formosensis]|uniref:MarR family winged helix-turn-helix transcriptional regulator n=1 Tax=Flavisphingomonas formosensis TaxID=861534 RepID=UPI0012FB7669|nr:MarR family transcriptional regulator [Sphingomonas formosensis]